MKKIPLLLAVCFVLLSSVEGTAQEPTKDKKDKKEKKYKDDRTGKEKDKEAKEWSKKDKDKNKDYDENNKNGDNGGILGKVSRPRKGGPRKLSGVPPGHYPPPGSCRIWYPNRPPGHQPPPTSCNSLVGVRLDRGAFILHGDRAYDSEYDWRKEERRRPGSVGRDILDILSPPVNNNR